MYLFDDDFESDEAAGAPLYESYPRLRQIVSQEYQYLSDEELEWLVSEMFADALTAEDIEFSLRQVGRGLARVGRQAAPIAAQLAPVAGAAIGTAVAPGIGTALGGALGSVAGQALGQVSQPRPRTAPSQQPTAARPPAAVRQPTAQRGEPARRGQGRQGGARTVQASPAAMRLTGILANPRVQQALLSLLLGQAGRESVRLDGTSVPVGAVAKTIEVFAREAAIERAALHSESGETMPAYLFNEAGELLVDPASEEAKAALVEQLIEVDSQTRERAYQRKRAALMSVIESQYAESQYSDASEEAFDLIEDEFEEDEFEEGGLEEDEFDAELFI